MGEESFEKWHEKYLNEKKIDINKFLNDENQKNLKKFGIEIKKDLYTTNEYCIIKYELLKYFESEDDTLEEKINKKELVDVGVTQTEYNNLIECFEKIDSEYGVF